MGELYNRNYYDDKTVTGEYPLTHARIGYDNGVNETSLTASSSAAGFPASHLATPFTFELWKPDQLPASVSIDLEYARAVDYIAIGAHTLGSMTLTFEYSDDAITYTTLQTAVLEDNGPMMICFNEVTSRYWRITFEGWAGPTLSLDFTQQLYLVGTYDGSTGGASAGALFLGKSLIMQRMIYGGHSPSRLSRDVRYTTNTSDGGQWLGRSVVRRSESASFSWQNLDSSWYRDNFEPFVEYAVENPFFIAWRPDGYANEVTYGYTSADVEPSNMGVKNFMSVGLQVTGHRSSE